MNIENINSAIAIMTRHMEAQLTLDMSEWQKDYGQGEYVAEEKHLCGTPCCFAGYIAVSPEFHADGGNAGDNGEPQMRHLHDDQAIREWLGCHPWQAAALLTLSNPRLAYPDVRRRPIRFPDVIAALVSLRDTSKLPSE